jgi:DNA-binding NarL/FixJ family response regulator
VSTSQDSFEPLLPAALSAVAEAAGARLRAETDGDAGSASSAADALLNTATSAMNAGYSLTEIAQAEARGKDDVRNNLRGDALKRVERSGRHAREAESEHHAAIARAMRLGLSTREIAAAAGVTHGTVRAISNRVATRDPGGDEDRFELDQSS